MTPIVVWYLILTTGYRSGTVAIPQASREQCLENVAWVKANASDYTPGVARAFCLPGGTLKVQQF